MKATIAKHTTQQIKVNSNGGVLQSTTPITLKNQISEIQSIEDIRDVSEVEVVSGSTLVYNPENDKYEVRKLTAEDVNIESFDLDGGTF